jgi:hypothetical protein
MEEAEATNHLQGSYGGDTSTVKMRARTGKNKVAIEKLGKETKIDNYIQKTP